VKRTSKKKRATPIAATGRFRNRIKELRYVPASELRAHPFNWREHPAAQRDGVLGSLSELGWIDAAIARETPDGLELIDGHLRASLDSDEPVPVLLVDLTDDEARLAIATHDKHTEAAHQNDAILAELLAAYRRCIRIAGPAEFPS
jgi:ParB-like chromosome segregation protein Spo0J